ncbi:P-loop containing nucleoside triphosphate hydrolase protein [Irpex rosettiformis]|uniref:P-loop containing nucleoside triphosphate hydrolase protein n=1 Tax=Irpex rosettiformis TaxID=378272 RepID=A0ACB8TQB6_9APHY|nr:P-loop containing nucleoside triphosphate hydrolase protein [Irpex rosettiformis]
MSIFASLSTASSSSSAKDGPPIRRGDATETGSVSAKASVCRTVNETEYAVRRRKHLDLIKQLRAIGAQADLDLPRIVVIGNQSAGKSSLVEAISGINVPRDAGTCTRCPMECRLASSSPEDPWTCEVYIRWEFDASGEPLSEVYEVPFGHVITNKSEVELMLRRAQSAVLNPPAGSSLKEREKEAEKFVRMSVEDLRRVKNKLKFSANAICMDLKGPGLTDLAFVDLPGIIQNADPETVKMVEDMVMDHIEGNCLILLTIPMSDDIENQKAARLAKQVDPSGQRTIGVLTKPDTLTVGAVKSKENWLAVLEGRRDRTAHGYYCTRQPDDDERARGISSAEARAEEKAFFARTAPWSGSKARQRFGTENLVESLASLLSKIIDETLPKLQSEVAQQLGVCLSELEELPPPITSDPSSFVLNLVLDFCNKVKCNVEGDVASARLVQQNRRIYANFKRDIRDSALLFLPYAKAADIPDDSNVHQFFRFDEDGETNIDEYRSEDGSVSQGKYMYLSDIQQHVRNALTRELPDNVPYAVKVALIRQSQASWAKLAEGCWKNVRRAFEKVLSELVDAKFHRYDHLHTRVTKIIADLVRKQTDVASVRVQDTLALESVPFTQNGHYFQVTKAKYLSLYKDARSGKLQVPIQEPKRLRVDRSEEGTTTSTAIDLLTPNHKSNRKIAGGSKGKKAKLMVDLTTEGDSSPISKTPSGGGPATPASAGVFNFTAGFGSPASSTPFTFGAKASGPAPPRTAFGQPGVFLNGAAAPSPAFGGSSQAETTEPVHKKSRVKTNDMVRSSESSSTNADSLVPATPTKASSKPPADMGASAQKRSSDKEAEREELTNQALSALAALGYHVTAADLGKLNPPDIYESELELMAEVRAYFQIAYKRVIDYVPMTVDHAFLFGFANALQEVLVDQLGLGTPNSGARCAAYLTEDSRIVALRDELSAKKRRLEGVQTELDNFGL